MVARLNATAITLQNTNTAEQVIHAPHLARILLIQR